MFAELAQQEKIESVVNLSQYLAELDSHPSKQTKEHKQSYQVLSDANIGASHLIPGWFADNVFGTALFITQLGRLPFPLGKGRSPVVANEDIAAVAVSLLQDPADHDGTLSTYGSAFINNERHDGVLWACFRSKSQGTPDAHVPVR
jgi:NAD(P)H dehydrogenase (quinone)